MSFDPGPRIRNRIATERAIEAAAVSLVQVQGYAKTTARDIAQAAGTTERTFFRYCPAKVDAFRFGVQWVLEAAGWCIGGQPGFADLVSGVEQTLGWLERTRGHPRRHLMRVTETIDEDPVLSAAMSTRDAALVPDLRRTWAVDDPFAVPLTVLALRESLSTCARVGETRLAQTFVVTCRRLADSARH
ncbi:TetR family transcriptional regulator [Microbacterium sp. M1A1_1b]